MRAECTFEVLNFEPMEYDSPIATGVAIGFASMDKVFHGEIAGRSRTQFTSAFDAETQTGTYVAMESFEGSVNGRSGCFNFAHMASTDGASRSHFQLVIVPASGTGDLAGISGTGDLVVDDDGTHRIVLDYDFG
jgi:hypothetical protein